MSTQTGAGYLLGDPTAPAVPADRATARVVNDYAGARVLLAQRLEGAPYGAEDLQDSRAPVLIPIDEQSQRHGAGPFARGPAGPARPPHSPPTPIRFADWFWE
jgi:hypothetical protein